MSERMEKNHRDSVDLVPMSISVEGGLAILAILGGWLFGIDVVDQLRFGETSTVEIAKVLTFGFIGMLPMVGLLCLIETWPWRPFQEMRKFSRETLTPMFSGIPIAGLFVISLAAGFGEELLFRGLLQAAASQWLPIPLAIIIAGALFGMLHYLSATYAVLATLMGCYLGFLFVGAGNIWVPIISHASYDFVALLYLTRQSQISPKG